MAVKHKVVENRDSQDSERLNRIVRALQEINTNSENQIPSAELSKICENIVLCLGTIHMPKSPENYSSFMKDVHKVEEILSEACTSKETIFDTLKALYNSISDPNKEPSPTMSIVLQLIDVRHIPPAVKWILNFGYSEQSLEQALLTLCKWLSQWTLTPNLGPLVLYFMEGLEAEHHYEILLKVTLKYIEKLFKLIILQQNRKFVAPVVFYMLRSMLSGPEAFHAVVPHVPKVLEFLIKENSESSQKCAEEIVSLCIALMTHFPHDPIYDDLKLEIKHYNITPSIKQILNCKSWQERSNYFLTIPYTPGKVGLNNLGNTCYMNSVLQALFMTKLFRNDILVSTRDAMPLIAKLQSLFALLQFSRRSSLSPSEILNIARPPGFQQGHQHDSSEFLGYLLDVLHEQEKTIFSSTQAMEVPTISGFGGSSREASSEQLTVVHKSFGGRAVTVSRCGTCSTQSERADHFRDLQLSFPSTTDSQSVQTLLNYYLQPEKLCDDNQYHCDNCQQLTDGERVTRVVEPPLRLILTLKQFRYDSISQQRTKILQRVNLDNIIILENAQYELYAAVVHCGSSVDSGHYYTFARDEQDWFKFNDASVLQTKSDELNGLKPPETPYILFYRRIDSTEPELIIQTDLCNRLQSLLIRDNAEVDADRRRRQVKFNSSSKIIRKDDDEPPPPGCGGGGFMDVTPNRFVW